MKKISVYILTHFFVSGVVAQHQELNEKPALWKIEASQLDTASLLSAFKRGQLTGHFRYYFMATDNKGELTDYYAHAAGGGIKFETARFKNFQLGVSGFFVFNIGSADLSSPDRKTNQMNRYEIGLFDIEDPHNKNDIDRLEELYLKYHYKSSTLTFGKQLINTPFINLQDGRMRPTEVEGFWTDINTIKNFKIQAGYLYGISPRSTVKWYRVDESIGIYPSGVTEQGLKSQYTGNLESKGIYLAGLTYRHPSKIVQLQWWNQFTENIFNSLLLQADFETSLKNGAKGFASLQFIRQDALHHGGNADPAKTYFRKGAKAISFGGRAGWKNDRWETSLNYNRITSHGRYLMPREWGRDPFFTFLPRERNEGLGDVHAIVGKLSYKIPAWRVDASIAAGHFDLPSVWNFKLNKYGLPAYQQFNIDIRYKFNGILKGLETQLLYVFKGKTGNTYSDDKYVINKVDMHLWNLVFNYQF